MTVENTYLRGVYRIGVHLVLFLVCLGLNSSCAFFNLSLAPQMSPLEEKVISGEGEDKILVNDKKGFI